MSIQMLRAWETTVSLLQKARFRNQEQDCQPEAGEVWVRDEQDLGVLTAMGRQRGNEAKKLWSSVPQP